MCTLGAGDFPSFAPHQAAPADIELVRRLEAVLGAWVAESGDAVSSPGYDDGGWRIRRMPATVLQTLQDDGPT